jgi:3-isopropylmalate dehydratase small subunit
MQNISGSVWKFDHNIDTDIIIPARYLVLPLAQMKHKAMAPIDPAFAGKVRQGDVIVAGRNFGCGSSREQAPAVLKLLGIQAIVAVSFARIFFRNAVNLGIPVLECDEAHTQIEQGETIEINPVSGEIVIPMRGITLSGSTLPEFLLAVVADGGLIPHLSKVL